MRPIVSMPQFEPQIQILYQLIDQIAAGQLLLPRRSREDAWTEAQALELFRSIRLGAPIGSIAVWRTNVLDVPCHHTLGPYPLKPPTGSIRTYVIDGHQRLAALFQALHVSRPPTALPERVASYDLREDDFFFAPSSEPPQPTWMPLRCTLEIALMIPFQRTLEGFPDARALVRSADIVSGAFKRYKIPVLPFATNDLDEIATTFQRIHGSSTVTLDIRISARDQGGIRKA